VELLDILKRPHKRHGLAGKVVAVYGRSPEGGGGVFEDVRIVHIGFHPFLVGRYVSQDPRDARVAGVVSWVAVGEISRLMVFDTVEAARRAFATESPATETVDG